MSFSANLESLANQKEGYLIFCELKTNNGVTKPLYFDHKLDSLSVNPMASYFLVFHSQELKLSLSFVGVRSFGMPISTYNIVLPKSFLGDHSSNTSAKRWVGVAKCWCLLTRWVGGGGQILTWAKNNIQGKKLFFACAEKKLKWTLALFIKEQIYI